MFKGSYLFLLKIIIYWQLLHQRCRKVAVYLKQKSLSRYYLERLLNYRAKNEIRTRDPNLGKVVLYQLSYFRFCENKCTVLFFFVQIFRSFFFQKLILILIFRTLSKHNLKLIKEPKSSYN